MIKLNVKNYDNQSLVTAKELEVNNLYEIVESPGYSTYVGSIVVRIKDSIWEIHNFNDCWTLNCCSFKFRKLNKGESITLTQD